MDSKKHESLTGEKASISSEIGGAFTAWGEHISGFNLVLQPGQRIVQAWRAHDWWADHFSVVTFDLCKVDGGQSSASRRSAYHRTASTVILADGSKHIGNQCRNSLKRAPSVTKRAWQVRRLGSELIMEISKKPPAPGTDAWSGCGWTIVDTDPALYGALTTGKSLVVPSCGGKYHAPSIPIDPGRRTRTRPS